jgi:hypothetical protein
LRLRRQIFEPSCSKGLKSKERRVEPHFLTLAHEVGEGRVRVVGTEGNINE